MGRTTRNDDVYLETHEFGREVTLAFEFPLCRSPLNDDIFALHVTKLAQPVPERLDTSHVRGKGCNS